MNTTYTLEEMTIREGTPFEKKGLFAITDKGPRMIQKSGSGEQFFTVCNRYAANMLEELYYNRAEDAIRMVKEGYADDLYFNGEDEDICLEPIPVIYLNREYGEKIHKGTLESLKSFVLKYIIKLSYDPHDGRDKVTVTVPVKFNTYEEAAVKVEYYATALSMYFESIFGKDQNYSPDNIYADVVSALVEKE